MKNALKKLLVSTLVSVMTILQLSVAFAADQNPGFQPMGPLLAPTFSGVNVEGLVDASAGVFGNMASTTLTVAGLKAKLTALGIGAADSMTTYADLAALASKGNFFVDTVFALTKLYVNDLCLAGGACSSVAGKGRLLGSDATTGALSWIDPATISNYWQLVGTVLSNKPTVAQVNITGTSGDYDLKVGHTNPLAAVGTGSLIALGNPVSNQVKLRSAQTSATASGKYPGRFYVDLPDDRNATPNWNTVMVADGSGKVAVKGFLSSDVNFAFVGSSFLNTSLISVNTVGASKVAINTVATLTKSLMAENVVAKNDVALNFVGGNVFTLGPIVSLNQIRGQQIGRFENTLVDLGAITRNTQEIAACNQNALNDFVVTGCHFVSDGGVLNIGAWVSNDGKSCIVKNNSTTVDATGIKVQARCFSPSGFPSSGSDPVTPIGELVGIPFYQPDNDPYTAIGQLYDNDPLDNILDASLPGQFEGFVQWDGQEPSAGVPDLPGSVEDILGSLGDLTNPIGGDGGGIGSQMNGTGGEALGKAFEGMGVNLDLGF